jgi:hypothetical protein
MLRLKSDRLSVSRQDMYALAFRSVSKLIPARSEQIRVQPEDDKETAHPTHIRAYELYE